MSREVFALFGSATLTYSLGDRAETYNGKCGTVLRRFKEPRKSIQVSIQLDDGTIWTCPEHHIRKVWSVDNVT